MKVKEYMTLSKKRVLPISGRVLVKEGQTVSPETVVAEMKMLGEPHIVKAALLLRIEPNEINEHMLKAVGDKVDEGEVIAQYIAFFGLIKRFVKSPVTGTIENIGASGWVTVRKPPVIVDLKAYIPGIVKEIIPERGAVIETSASYIQGIFGVGGETYGPLRVLVNSFDEVLTAEMITPESKGKIIVGGSFVTLKAVRKATEVGVAGIVVGGFGGDDLTGLLGYEMGVAITGEEEIGTTLIITEGFGEIAMSHRSFSLLKKLEGQVACISGATQIRAGVIRPEVIIPQEQVKEKAIEDEISSGMRPGTPIRIIRQPYFGYLGSVVSLPMELQTMESESNVRVVEVELDDGRRVTVPRANVEIIEI
ncbi:hypothetical protein KKC06_06570 [Patescibacteria group bacterium]|nr:hypothetical protein [Patescibacteria group bacterium]